MQDRFFNFNSKEYTQNGILDLDSQCNSINVLNTGTGLVTVNGIPLAAPVAGQSVGDSYTIGGNRGEILTGRVQLTFDNEAGKAVVIQKYYTTTEKC